jgi:XTP/dITP diphosphohydrolase
MTDLLIGTTNPGKVREYAALLASLCEAGVTLRSLGDVGLDSRDLPEPFDTFDGNARHKAQTYAAESGLMALADDSGLVIDALDGRPGVYSARYAGDGATDRQRYEKVLDELRGVPDAERTARFVCVVAIASPDGAIIMGRGAVEGQIAHMPGKGEFGFGYDPIFVPAGYDAALGDLPKDEKNRISHRGRAVVDVLPALRRLIGIDHDQT